MTGGPLTPEIRFALAGFDVRLAMLDMSDGKTDQPAQLDIVLGEDRTTVFLYIYPDDTETCGIVSFRAFDAPIDPGAFDRERFCAIIADSDARVH